MWLVLLRPIRFSMAHRASILLAVTGVLSCGTLNPVSPTLLARAAMRLEPRATSTTGDMDIVRRRWMLIDCDPVRPSDVSATDAELALALGRIALD